ncbi:MAG: prepilin-type N-terminal cleavage/methylation domain-containing protein [Planctomycetota bacterium]|nr:prepilin-type N-terminal cleavage/methylation domain-containing protein [Planctomycetota bacterium]
MISNLDNPNSARAPRRSSGFTLVEVLVVVGLIVLLLGILGVTFSGVFRDSRRAATEQYLMNIGFAIEQFRTDFNYYPPLIKDDPSGFATPSNRLTVANEVDELEETRWHSVMTLPMYLIGVGDINGDDNDEPEELPLDDGVGGPGLRDPGLDQSWGGADNRTDHNAPVTGRTYGPYMDVAAGSSFRRAVNADFRINASDFDPQEILYTFTDRWDRPIRYYRSWPVRNTARDRSLEEIPLELIDSAVLEPDDAPRVADDRDLLNAPFALLSAGPDGFFGDTVMEGGDPLENDFLLGKDYQTLLDADKALLHSSNPSRPGRLDDNIRMLP